MKTKATFSGNVDEQVFKNVLSNIYQKKIRFTVHLYGSF